MRLNLARRQRIGNDDLVVEDMTIWRPRWEDGAVDAFLPMLVEATSADEFLGLMVRVIPAPREGAVVPAVSPRVGHWECSHTVWDAPSIFLSQLIVEAYKVACELQTAPTKINAQIHASTTLRTQRGF